MNDREALTITSRERLRREIAEQTELFLRTGGRIERLQIISKSARPIGPVWWDVRGNGSLLQA